MKLVINNFPFFFPVLIESICIFLQNTENVRKSSFSDFYASVNNNITYVPQKKIEIFITCVGSEKIKKTITLPIIITLITN